MLLPLLDFPLLAICASVVARAKFVYTLIGNQGAIVMKIGNMTMTERHRAQRIGECPHDDSASILRMHEDFRMPPEPQREREP